VTDERWQLAYAIYEAAAPLAEPERSRYVHAAAPDAETAGKVLAMLDEMESAADSGLFPNLRILRTLLPLRLPAPCRSALRSAVLSSRVSSARGAWAESIPPTTLN